MSHSTDIAEQILQQVAADTVNGVANFSDGTNNVGMTDPLVRLEVRNKILGDEGQAVAARTPAFGLRFTKINGPCGGFQ